jgi:uncharacterized membrane protein
MTFLSRIVVFLFCLFCVAYPIALIGVAFDIHPPFSMTWAGSVLLILEGTMLAVALMDQYGPYGLLAVLAIAVLAYGVEALGVGTGFPFGVYHYTDVLVPRLPGGVPLAVIFAWLMIMIAVYCIMHSPTPIMGGCLITGLLAPVLATLLDLEIEPVAFHLEHYWEWSTPGSINYYGIPLSNFVAWFVVALILNILVSIILLRTIGFLDLTSFASRLPTVVPPLIFTATVLMFGVVDLTHGYYLGVGCAIVAGILLLIIKPFPHFSAMLAAPLVNLRDDQVYPSRSKQVKKTRKARKKKNRY